MENIEQAQVPSQDVGGEQAPAQPELNIADLQNIRAVIDTAVRRGAFGAAEATAVGSVFDRLNTFLTAVAPTQPSAEQPTPTAE
jgi:hypothetical protein